MIQNVTIWYPKVNVRLCIMVLLTRDLLMLLKYNMGLMFALISVSFGVEPVI